MRLSQSFHEIRSRGPFQRQTIADLVDDPHLQRLNEMGAVAGAALTWNGGVNSAAVRATASSVFFIGGYFCRPLR